MPPPPKKGDQIPASEKYPQHVGKAGGQDRKPFKTFPDLFVSEEECKIIPRWEQVFFVRDGEPLESSSSYPPTTGKNRKRQHFVKKGRRTVTQKYARSAQEVKRAKR